jgi:hydroxymethylbilane synthase
MARQLNDPPSETAARIERKFLAYYEGGCQLPIGGLARLKDDQWHFRAFIGGVKSYRMVQDFVQDPDPENCAFLMFERLQAQGGRDLLAELHLP